MHDVLGSNPNVMLIYHFDFFSYILVYTIMYQVYLSIYWYIPVCTSIAFVHGYILVYTSMYHVCLSIYCYILVYTRFISVHSSMYFVYVDTYHSGILSST